ncbi:unnamed protein product, partial [Leptidea sinapis]
MIRGGLEYNLGIYITGVDKDSVADRAGLMVGDQILEVNGQSFVDVTHDEAVGQLKYHKRMSLLVRDVGKVPHACTAYGDRESAPRISGWGRRRGAASVAVEQKAKSLLPQIREFVLPEDRPRFDELVYRREEAQPPQDLHLKRGGDRHMLPPTAMHDIHDPVSDLTAANTYCMQYNT